MATYTTNLNLKKPAQSDKIRIADINNNMDDIDAAFGAVGTDSLATQLGDIQGAIAIVATGNTHAAISAGQFVYVKSHETLDTGLYTANSNISANGTLSSSNLTADTAGGLNALSDQIGSKINIIWNGTISTDSQNPTRIHLYNFHLYFAYGARSNKFGAWLFITQDNSVNVHLLTANAPDNLTITSDGSDLLLVSSQTTFRFTVLGYL